MSSLKRKMKRKKTTISNDKIRAIKAVRNYEANNTSVCKTKHVMPDDKIIVENAMKQLRASDVANILSVNEDIMAGKSFNVMEALTPNVKNVIEAYAISTGINLNDRQAMSVFAQITLGTLVQEYHIDELYGKFVKEVNNAFSTISLVEEMIISRKDRYERLFLDIANKPETKEEDKHKLLAMSNAFTQSYDYKKALEYTSEDTTSLEDICKSINDELTKYNITLENTGDILKVVTVQMHSTPEKTYKFAMNMLEYFKECEKDDDISIIPIVRKFYFFDILIMLTRLDKNVIEHDFTKELLSTLEEVLNAL